MSEDLRGSLESAFDSVPPMDEIVHNEPVPADVPGDALPVETGENQRERDEHGRFKAKEGVPDVPADKIPPVPNSPEKPDSSKSPSGQPAGQPAPIAEKQFDTTRAPSSWKKEIAALFPTLPPEVQAEIHRRETDFHKGYEGQFEESPAYKQMAPLAEVGSRIQAITEQYRANYEKYNINGEQAIGELFRMDHDLRNAPPAVKVQKMLDLAQHYGIDMSEQFAPEVAQLQQRMYDLEQQNKQYMEAQQRAQTESLVGEILAFAKSPGHEHFEKVRGHMQALLQSGQVTNLQDAYDQAIYANPETRKDLLEQQSRIAQEQVTSKRAKTAAMSVKGSTPASGIASTPSSLREAISAAFEQT